MKREQIAELENIIRDLRMAMEIKEQLDAGVERDLIDFADGTRISIPIPKAVKSQLDDKIVLLTSLLKEKAVKV